MMDPIMNSQPIEVIDMKGLNRFKHPKIVHNGYMYHFSKKCAQHFRWKCRCVSLKCPAVLRTTMDMSEITYIAVDHKHVHENDLVEIEALKKKINEHKQSSLSRKNTSFISKDLDEVFEEIHLPENPDYKNGNTEKYGKLMKNTNSKDTIFNFENNPLNRLEPKNNKNQIEINLEDSITKNHTSYSFNEELKNKNQICRATLPNEHNITINNNKNKNKFSLRNIINKRNYILYKKNQIKNNALISSKKKKKHKTIANTHTFKRSLTTNTNKRKNVKTTNKQKNKSTLITNASRQTILSKVKPRKYTSKLTNQNLPINTTTTTSTPVLKSISTIGSSPSVKVTNNMIESRLNKNIDNGNENENESISDGDYNNDDDDDDFIFGSDEAIDAVIDDNEENNIKLMQEDCILHLNYSKKKWSTIFKKISDPLTRIKVFESIFSSKVLIQMMQGNNRINKKLKIFKIISINNWKKKFYRLQHNLNTLKKSTRSDRNLRCIGVLNKKEKQLDFDTEYRNVDALSRVQVNDEAKIDGEDKDRTRPTRTRRPPAHLSEYQL